MIRIEEVTANNVFDVCELTTNKDGIGTTIEEFICCNATSIAEAKYFLEMHPKAIYDDSKLIGFVMYKILEKESVATICRFMIDYRYQGQGLGRKAFAKILEYLKDIGITKVILMIDKENIRAKNLYSSFGFVFNGVVEKEEFYYERNLY